MRVGNDRVEQVWERISGDRLEMDLLEEGLPSCTQSQLDYLHHMKRSQSPLAIYSSTGLLER